jgi:hypothetical protein
LHLRGGERADLPLLPWRRGLQVKIRQLGSMDNL